MFGVNSILGCSERLEKEDYYKLLKCDETSTIDQINAEFKLLALECHPDKNPDSDTLQKFQCLQEARLTLIDPKLRSDYDKWRASEMSMTFKEWKALGTRCQPTMHWAKPRTQTMIEAKTSLEDVRYDINNSQVPINSEGIFRKLKTNTQLKTEPQTDIYEQFRNYRI